jgi:RND family efflux transporter MFP subunit
MVYENITPVAAPEQVPAASVGRNAPFGTLLRVLLAAAALCAGASFPLFAADPAATLRMELREVEQTWATDGVVEAVRQSTVAAQISGRIVEIAVDAGSRVRKGQLLARIDPRETGEALAGSRAQVAQAQAALTQSALTLERGRNLFAQKFVSQAALDKAVADHDAAKAQLAQAEAGVGQTAAARSFADVLAPFDGVVSARLVDLGEMASPGKPLVTLFEPKGMRVVATVPQHRFAEIKSGMRGFVEIAGNGSRIRATAVTMLPNADPRTLSTRVRLELPADAVDAAGLVPGMYAKALFALGSAKKFAVPASAIVRRSELSAVYVVGEKNAVSLRQVRLGESLGDGLVEVLAGIEPGESIMLDAARAGMRK